MGSDARRYCRLGNLVIDEQAIDFVRRSDDGKALEVGVGGQLLTLHGPQAERLWERFGEDAVDELDDGDGGGMTLLD